MICVDYPQSGFNRSHRNILLSYFVWLGATRTFKLLPHLWRCPEHIIYVPAFIIFGYYFAIMKLYALCTLHEVSFLHLVTTIFRLTFIIFRQVGVHVLVSVMLQPLPQPLIDKPMRKTTTSTTLICDRLSHLILVTLPPAPSNYSTILHPHRHTVMNQHKHPSIIIGNTRNAGQEIEVRAVGGDPRTMWSCKLRLRDDRITCGRINMTLARTRLKVSLDGSLRLCAYLIFLSRV